MKLDLTRIRKAEDHLERTFAPSELPVDGEVYEIAAPVALVFDIHKDRDAFRLVGSVRTTLSLPCSRCLEPYDLVVDATFDQRYLPQAAAGEGEVEVAEDDLETSYYRDDEIDLDELLREQFYLALPMKPLCREDCQGLCPHCGIDLNVERCDCGPAWVEPRLAELRKLRQ